MSVVRNHGFAICIFALWLYASAAAQQKMLWQGVVKPEAINVYQSASTNERVTATLKQGDVVDVVLEVSISGSEWCRVAGVGTSEPLGFVLCLNLEQGGASPAHVSPAISAAPPVAPVVAPNSPKPPEAKPSGKATVVLYRPSRFIDASRKATIYVDNRPLCVLTNNTSFRFEIPTGPHSLATLFNRQTTGETALPASQFNFVADNTYYFTLTKNWLIFAVSTQQGESESRRTKPLKESNISVQPSGNELN
jgi:hypothetical protein